MIACHTHRVTATRVARFCESPCSLGSNSIGVEGARALAAVLKTWLSLESLKYGRICVGLAKPKGERSVSDRALCHNFGVGDVCGSTASVYNNNFGAEGASALAIGLKDCHTLKELEYGICRLDCGEVCVTPVM